MFSIRQHGGGEGGGLGPGNQQGMTRRGHGPWQPLFMVAGAAVMLLGACTGMVDGVAGGGSNSLAILPRATIPAIRRRAAWWWTRRVAAGRW